MIRRIILAAALLCSVSVTACEINYASGLSEQDKQDLKILCEQKRAAAMRTDGTGVVKAVESIDPETIDKIKSISTALVDAVVGIAKGLGVEVNNFIQSPAGAIITTILVFYLVGSKIWGVFILLIIALIARVFLLRLKSIASNGTVTETQLPVLWGLYVRTVKTTAYVPYSEWKESDRNNYMGAVWITAFVLIVSVVIVAVNV